MIWGTETIAVDLRPFNNHQLPHDLMALCGQVNTNAPCLPDGRFLQLRLWATAHATALEDQLCAV